MKVLVISTSRADVGALYPVYKELLKLKVDAKYEMIHLTSPRCKDEVVGNYRYSSTMTTELVNHHNPDFVMVCGDRYETLAVATTAYLYQIPIIHLSGGDVTEGSQDDSMRHAITKLSHLHFPTCIESCTRIEQLGENPDNIYPYGSPTSYITEDDILPLSKFNMKFQTSLEKDKYLLVVWHPNTLVSDKDSLNEFEIVCKALEKIKLKKVFVGSNNDAGNQSIKICMCKNCTSENNNFYFEELAREEYLCLLNNAACLVGNSSSGFYEAPYLGVPVVNIGDRQKGREYISCILDCPIKISKITSAIKSMIRLDKPEILKRSMYNVAEDIAREISKIKVDPKSLLRKKFNDINME